MWRSLDVCGSGLGWKSLEVWRMSNRQKIIGYLKEHGSITALDASDRLRITSLSQEITRLEQDGCKFIHERECNEESHWTRYSLIPSDIDLEVIGL